MAKTSTTRNSKSKKSSTRVIPERASTRRAKAGKKKSDAVTVDRREPKVKGSDRREASDRRQTSEPVAVERRALERREKVNRRRQIDPTTCEREYSDAEIQFMSALDEYKRKSGRMFPTCSEILEVITGLGYRQTEAAIPVTGGFAETPDADPSAVSRPTSVPLGDWSADEDEEADDIVDEDADGDDDDDADDYAINDE